MKVYLAGGLHSNWRAKVRHGVPTMDYFDPILNVPEACLPEQYGNLELIALRNSDVIFVYMDTDNPSGFGLSLEFGYAKALGIPILLVFSKGFKQDERNKRFNFHRQLADTTVVGLEQGIKVLAAYLEIL